MKNAVKYLILLSGILGGMPNVFASNGNSVTVPITARTEYLRVRVSGVEQREVGTHLNLSTLNPDSYSVRVLETPTQLEKIIASPHVSAACKAEAQKALFGEVKLPAYATATAEILIAVPKPSASDLRLNYDFVLTIDDGLHLESVTRLLEEK